MSRSLLKGSVPAQASVAARLEACFRVFDGVLASVNKVFRGFLCSFQGNACHDFPLPKSS